MSPVEMHANEVQFYASPVLVKSQQYYATLTSERLILEGNGPTREFRVSSLSSAKPVTVGSNEPAVEITLSTPGGRKEMIWTFPVDSVFKTGEQSAWVEKIEKASGSIDMPLRQAGAAPPVSQTRYSSSNTGTTRTYPAPAFQRGETEILNTSGVRIKRAFYTLYLTNLRMILQNNLGKIGREFSISDITDASLMDTETGEPSIVLSVGSQGGIKQMLLTFPTGASRDAWMRELQVHLPSRKPVSVSKTEPAASKARIGTFIPAVSERLLESTKDIRIKSNFVIAHLTNTRLVIEGRAGIVGEFAVSTLVRAVRMAGDIGEPGIALLIRGRDGEREMHMVFQSMDDREKWMHLFEDTIPKEAPEPFAPEAKQYTVTEVNPPRQQNTAVRYCPVCGARNHIDDAICGMCGSSLAVRESESFGEYESERPQRRERAPRAPRSPRPPRPSRPPRVQRERVRREKAAYNGSVIGFITRPSDAFMYYCREQPRDAVGTYLLSGIIWAVVTTLLVTFVLPAVLTLDDAEFPIFSSLAENIVMMLVFMVMLYIIWLVLVFLAGLLAGLAAHLFSPQTSIGEIVAVFMRTSMTHAVIGWIPVIGTFIASIWAGICSAKGIEAGQNMSVGGSFAAAFIGIILVFVLVFVLGIVGGGM